MLVSVRDLYFFEQDYKTFLFENDFVAIFPEFFLVGSTIALLLYGVVYTTSKKKTIHFYYPIVVG